MGEDAVLLNLCVLIADFFCAYFSGSPYYAIWTFLRATFKTLHAQNGPCRICCFAGFDCCAAASWGQSHGHNRWEERGCRGRPGGLDPGEESRSVAKWTRGRCILQIIRWNFFCRPPAQRRIIIPDIQSRTGSRWRRLPGRRCAAHRQTPGQEQREPQAEQQARLCQHQETRWVRMAAKSSTVYYKKMFYFVLSSCSSHSSSLCEQHFSRNLCDLFYCTWLHVVNCKVVVAQFSRVSLPVRQTKLWCNITTHKNGHKVILSTFMQSCMDTVHSVGDRAVYELL